MSHEEVNEDALDAITNHVFGTAIGLTKWLYDNKKIKAPESHMPIVVLNVVSLFYIFIDRISFERLSEQGRLEFTELGLDRLIAEYCTIFMSDSSANPAVTRAVFETFTNLSPYAQILEPDYGQDPKGTLIFEFVMHLNDKFNLSESAFDVVHQTIKQSHEELLSGPLKLALQPLA